MHLEPSFERLYCGVSELTPDLQQSLKAALGEEPPPLGSPEWEAFYAKLASRAPHLQRAVDSFLAQRRVEQAREVRPPEVPPPQGVKRAVYRPHGKEWVVDKGRMWLALLLGIAVVFMMVYFVFLTPSSSAKAKPKSPPPTAASSEVSSASASASVPVPPPPSSEPKKVDAPVAKVPASSSSAVPPPPPLPQPSGNLPPPPDYQPPASGEGQQPLTTVYTRPAEAPSPAIIYQRGAAGSGSSEGQGNEGSGMTMYQRGSAPEQTQEGSASSTVFTRQTDPSAPLTVNLEGKSSSGGSAGGDAGGLTVYRRENAPTQEGVVLLDRNKSSSTESSGMVTVYSRTQPESESNTLFQRPAEGESNPAASPPAAAGSSPQSAPAKSAPTTPVSAPPAPSSGGNSAPQNPSSPPDSGQNNAGQKP